MLDLPAAGRFILISAAASTHRRPGRQTPGCQSGTGL